MCRPVMKKPSKPTDAIWEEARQYRVAECTQVACDAPGLENQSRFAALTLKTRVHHTRFSLRYIRCEGQSFLRFNLEDKRERCLHLFTEDTTSD